MISVRQSDRLEPAAAPPAPVRRPRLALWLFERNLRLKDAEGPLGVGLEQVRRYCLPFGHNLRSVPTAKVMARIVAWTDGQVGPADFYDMPADAPTDAEARP